jgi:hypothetical protein
MGDVFYTQDFNNLGHTGLEGDDLNLIQTQAQAEWERRSREQLGDGVIDSTSFVAALDVPGLKVDFTAGAGAYFRGKRYTTGGSVVFSGSDGAGTYFLYLDTSGVLQKATTRPAAAVGLTLASAAWDGATTLSALTDMRRVGSVGSGQLQLKTVSGTLALNVGAGLSADVVINYGAQADFAVVLDRQAWCDEGMSIRVATQLQSGERTYGSQLCLEIDNEGESNYETTLHWQVTGLLA